VGRTEREVALDLEQEMRRAGAVGPSFPSIVAAGAHGALPHAVPRDQPIPAGTLVVIDWGAILDGYCSDCTRTVATGPIDDEAIEAYELVRRAQQTGLEAVTEGARCAAVDAAAREVIEAAGLGERFGHSLGHGVGLEVHEGPTLSKRSESDLAVGNVVSVEPGVYLPGRFGIRIEDLVAVTADGADVFTRLPKELLLTD
jgi:Xaa-Pro aminopeptidase